MLTTPILDRSLLGEGIVTRSNGHSLPRASRRPVSIVSLHSLLVQDRGNPRLRDEPIGAVSSTSHRAGPTGRSRRARLRTYRHLGDGPCPRAHARRGEVRLAPAFEVF